MRNVFPPQMSIGQRDIADIKIDVSSKPLLDPVTKTFAIFFSFNKFNSHLPRSLMYKPPQPFFILTCFRAIA
jgi:hypothetical protein